MLCSGEEWQKHQEMSRQRGGRLGGDYVRACRRARILRAANVRCRDFSRCVVGERNAKVGLVIKVVLT